MVKTQIKLPEGFECDDGTCLEKPISFKVDIPEVQPVIKRVPEAQIGERQTQVMQEKPQEAKAEPQKEVQKVVPSWQPNYICKGPNCNTKKNPNYQARPKGKCSKCGQFTKEAFGTCIWCNNNEIDEVSEDELDDLGVPRPEESEEMQEVD